MAKKLKPYILITGFLVVLLIAFASKKRMNNFISETMQKQVSNELADTAEQLIQRKYNYDKNGLNYDFTFLEFSSTGCPVCKQMEPVLEEVRNSQIVKMNVVFLHIMKSENLDLMKYYGISAVPMQILLDKQGKEFFRHYGYISANDILAKAIPELNQK